MYVAIIHISHNYTHQPAKTCFENESRRDLEPLEIAWIKVDVSGFDAFCVVTPLIAWAVLAKRQRVAEGTKILLDIAKESSDWFAPLKSALGGVCALVKHYEVNFEWTRLTWTTDAGGRSNSKM